MTRTEGEILKKEVSKRKARTGGIEQRIPEERQQRVNHEQKWKARVLYPLNASKPTFIDFHARAVHICVCVLCELSMKGFQIHQQDKKLPRRSIYGCFNPTVTLHPKSTDLEVTSIWGSHFLTL